MLLGPACCFFSKQPFALQPTTHMDRLGDDVGPNSSQGAGDRHIGDAASARSRLPKKDWHPQSHWIHFGGLPLRQKVSMCLSRPPLKQWAFPAWTHVV